MEDERVIGAALRAGVREALRAHKKAGNWIVVYENGKVVWLPPEKIVIPGEVRRRAKKAKNVDNSRRPEDLRG